MLIVKLSSKNNVELEPQGHSPWHISIFGGMRRSTTAYIKFTAGTLFAHIHGQRP